jgi:hypothetical protein
LRLDEAKVKLHRQMTLNDVNYDEDLPDIFAEDSQYEKVETYNQYIQTEPIKMTKEEINQYQIEKYQ